MKKFICVIVAVLCLCIVGCGTNENNSTVVDNKESNTVNTVENKEDKKEDTSVTVVEEKKDETTVENSKEEIQTEEKKDDNQTETEKVETITTEETTQTEEKKATWEIEEEWLKGYFSENTVDVKIVCESGTADAYKIEGSTITFTGISEDSVYSISGKLNGNIVIDVDDDYKFELSLKGLSIVSENAVAIEAKGGDEIKISAKKGTSNYIYDYRVKVGDDEREACIYSATDLEIGGKGELVIVSKNNNGIQTKKDLKLQNLTLTVYCTDNAVKGNDEVEFAAGKYRLFATKGDAVKTSNDTVSKKGNQKGNIIVNEAVIEIYAAKDAFDAAHEQIIDYTTSTITINQAK